MIGILVLKPVLIFLIAILSFSGAYNISETDDYLLLGSAFNGVSEPLYSLEREYKGSGVFLSSDTEREKVLDLEEDIEDSHYSPIVVTEPEPAEPSVPPKSVSKAVPDVPFFSQSADIHSPEWRSRACGVASLAMVVELYYPGRTTPQDLLEKGLESGHFLYGIGWTHQGLATLAIAHGLHNSRPYDLSHMSMKEAYRRLSESLESGPVIASVFHKFDPQSPIPHLAVINGIDGNRVFYNDPDESSGGGVISAGEFMAGWKKRFIAVHP